MFNLSTNDKLTQTDDETDLIAQTDDAHPVTTLTTYALTTVNTGRCNLANTGKEHTKWTYLLQIKKTIQISNMKHR